MHESAHVKYRIIRRYECDFLGSHVFQSKKLIIDLHYSPCQGVAMSENVEKVLQAMKDAGKPVRPGQVAKVLGIESKEVSKAIKVLRKEGRVHSPKRCYYAPS
jgi:biotin operon repressor